jgi:hypothetical protein
MSAQILMIILGFLRRDLASPPPAGADFDDYSGFSAPHSGFSTARQRRF